jgi:hypothetical protein
VTEHNAAVAVMLVGSTDARVGYADENFVGPDFSRGGCFYDGTAFRTTVDGERGHFTNVDAVVGFGCEKVGAG